MARTGLEAAPADVEVTTRDERVVWRGLPGWDYGQPAQRAMAGHHHEHEDVEDDREHAADHHGARAAVHQSRGRPGDARGVRCRPEHRPACGSCGGRRFR